MSKTWFLCCVQEQKEWLREVIAALDSDARVHYFEDPERARRAVLESDAPTKAVFVGSSNVAEPINIAAAFVFDKGASEVVLGQSWCSGSFKKRASEAGISKVLDTNEMQALVSSLSRNGAHVLGDSQHAEPIQKSNHEGSSNTFELPDVAEDKKGFEYAHPIFMFASARGGVGKSSCAAMMALAAASWNMRVALVDLDLAFGNLFSFFALDGPADLSHIKDCSSHDAYIQLGKPVLENLVLFGPCSRPEYAEMASAHIGVFLKALAQSFDLVIVDGSSAWNEASAQAAQMAERVALVTDERAGAIGSLARAAGLCKRLGVARTRMVRLMNRADLKRRDEGFMMKAQLGLEAAKVLKVFEGDFDVEEFLGAGHARDLFALEEPFGKSCSHAMALVLSDLGCLPKNEVAQKALKSEVHKKPSIFSFASKAS